MDRYLPSFDLHKHLRPTLTPSSLPMTLRLHYLLCVISPRMVSDSEPHPRTGNQGSTTHI